MRTGILLRTIVAMNVLVLAVGGAVGWLGAQAAGELVEQRLLGQVSENAAGLVGRLNLPITPTLMGHLKRIFDVDVAIRQADGEWLASSLPGKDTATLRRKLKGDPVPETLTLADGVYRLRLQPVPAGRHGRADARRLELLLLVPVEQIAQARTAAQRRVAVVAIPAVAAATVLAAVLSLTIARPIRRLAGQMDRMASSSDPELHAATDRASEPGGPREVARLSESFDHLLDRLARAQAELARRERLAAVGTMSAAVAHELRNPLSGIKMNARLLRDELTQAAPAETLELMLGEIDRMDHTLQELLDLASTSPEGATIEVSPSAVNVADVAASVAQLLAGKFRHAGVSLETTVSGDLPAARADARRLRQVLMNLLLNALTATPSGGRVAIDAHAEAETVQLRVCDTGAGLDATQQEGVFEPFVSDTPGGAGLGLYVSRSIVEACGGTLEYADTAEGGCFVVTLGQA